MSTDPQNEKRMIEKKHKKIITNKIRLVFTICYTNINETETKGILMILGPKDQTI